MSKQLVYESESDESIISRAFCETIRMTFGVCV